MGGISVSNDVPTLTANAGAGRIPMAVSIRENIINRQDHNGGNGVGAIEENCYTLNASGVPAFYNGSVKLQYTLTGTHKLNGNKTLGGTIDLTEGHSLKVVVNQSSASGGLGITITANDELIADVDQNVTIDPYL